MGLICGGVQRFPQPPEGRRQGAPPWTARTARAFPSSQRLRQGLEFPVSHRPEKTDGARNRGPKARTSCGSGAGIVRTGQAAKCPQRETSQKVVLQAMYPVTKYRRKQRETAG